VASWSSSSVFAADLAGRPKQTRHKRAQDRTPTDPIDAGSVGAFWASGEEGPRAFRGGYLPPVVAMPLTRNRWPNKNTKNSGIKVTTDMANMAPQLLPLVASRNPLSATGTV
jgi:hypothetical protein